MSYLSAKIVKDGMGGFLNPPTHPEHDYSVKFRGGYSSLSYALNDETFSPYFRENVRILLDEWDCNRIPLNDPQMQEWIRKVLAYFRNCYRNPEVEEDKQWNTSHIKIDSSIDPMMFIDEHCGVHFIRKYYPRYNPKREHFPS